MTPDISKTFTEKITFVYIQQDNQKRKRNFL
jgi:hypothetical protein